MRAREGMLLFLFGLIVSLGHHWRLAGLQSVPLAWLPVVKLAGVLGLSALLVALSRGAWRILAATGEPHRPSPPALAPAVAPDVPPGPPEDDGEAGLLRESGLIDAHWYVGTYPDLAAADLDAARHYLDHGAAEGRNPNPFFDTSWYLEHNPDVRESGANPLVHYVVDGASEGRPTGPKFDTAFYLAENEDVAASGVNPLAHYLREGRFERRRGTAGAGA